SRRDQGIAVVLWHVLIAAGDLGERQHSVQRRRRIGIGIEKFLPSRPAQLDDLLEAFDPKFPEDVAVAVVDSEQRTVAAGVLHQRTRDTVVMLHDEAENPVDMVKIIKGRLLIAAIPIPDDWKPLAWFNEVWADQQTGDEA